MGVCFVHKIGYSYVTVFESKCDVAHVLFGRHHRTFNPHTFAAFKRSLLCIFTAETAFASSRVNFSAAVGLYIGDLECISTLLMWKLYSDLSHKGNFLETTLLYACMECMERIQIHGSSYCECT